METDHSYSVSGPRDTDDIVNRCKQMNLYIALL